MSQNTIEDLRVTLFETLRGLSAGTVDLDRAKAVGDISQTIINTGKLEVEFMRQTGQTGTTFIPYLAGPAPNEHETQTGIATRTPSGTIHRMR
jgi:hypothetical protein